MKDPVSIPDLTDQIARLYRPSPRGHWQRRIYTLICDWVGREDLVIPWSPDEEEHDASPVRYAVPDREQPPQWIGVGEVLTGRALEVLEILARHLAIVADVMSRHASPGDRSVPARWANQLTARQVDVAVLAATGQQNKEIGDELNIAPRTVARLLQEIYQRLAINSRAELAAECALGRPPTPVELRTPMPQPRAPEVDDDPKEGR